MLTTPGQVGAVLVPVKAFDRAKARLSTALEETDRAELAKAMATHVIGVQRNVAVAVCCDDRNVARWAEAMGATVIWCPGTGLNGSVQRGFSELRRAGYSKIAVAHSDLPLAATLDRLLDWNGVTLVPDRHGSGTNVIALSADIDFRFSYGAGSYQRHVVEAVRCRRGMRIVYDHKLSWDVDHPIDLARIDSELLRRYLGRKKEQRQ